MSNTCPLSTAVGSCTVGAGQLSWATNFRSHSAAAVRQGDSYRQWWELQTSAHVTGRCPGCVTFTQSPLPGLQYFVHHGCFEFWAVFSLIYSCIVSLVSSQSQLTAWFLRWLRSYEVYMIFVKELNILGWLLFYKWGLSCFKLVWNVDQRERSQNIKGTVSFSFNPGRYNKKSLGLKIREDCSHSWSAGINHNELKIHLSGSNLL